MWYDNKMQNLTRLMRQRLVFQRLDFQDPVAPKHHSRVVLDDEDEVAPERVVLDEDEEEPRAYLE